jgi:hypothetical protein
MITLQSIIELHTGPLLSLGAQFLGRCLHLKNNSLAGISWLGAREQSGQTLQIPLKAFKKFPYRTFFPKFALLS